MTIQQYLQANRPLLSLSAIARAAGISQTRFQLWVTDKPDGRGRPSKLSDEELARVAGVVYRLRR